MLAAQAAPLSDALLQRQIASQLAESNRQGLRSLAVNVVGGNVTLRGSVASFYEKQLAIQACRVLAGIDRLIDAVEVAGAN
ncbi:MAG: BON domain-containing protein [Pirellulaceae bacterium]